MHERCVPRNPHTNSTMHQWDSARSGAKRLWNNRLYSIAENERSMEHRWNIPCVSSVSCPTGAKDPTTQPLPRLMRCPCLLPRPPDARLSFSQPYATPKHAIRAGLALDAREH